MDISWNEKMEDDDLFHATALLLEISSDEERARQHGGSVLGKAPNLERGLKLRRSFTQINLLRILFTDHCTSRDDSDYHEQFSIALCRHLKCTIPTLLNVTIALKKWI